MSQTLQRAGSTECGESACCVARSPVDSGQETGISWFAGASGVGEWQVTVSAADSLESLEAHWLAALDKAGIPTEGTVLRRVFCSDVLNQAPLLDCFSRAYPGSFSAIGQAPAGGACFAMWSYHVTDGGVAMETSGTRDCFQMRRGSLRHVWLSGLHDAGGDDSAAQTRKVLEDHDRILAEHGMTLEDHVIRTWWYVRDIDKEYQGLVDARRDVFTEHGLTKETHYIASTGIGGGHHKHAAKLSLDSYAIRGLVSGQVKHLSAPDYLGPTHRYGVTFERATQVSYSDRSHIFLSGTASINPSGEIVHPGDVRRQFDRAIENIEALLAAADAGLRDLSVILVYLRDPADFPVIDRMVRQRFPRLPMVVLHAPVCRPGWLVEIEGIACISRAKCHFPDF